MNLDKIFELLDKWDKLIKTGELASLKKAKQRDGGINGRIKRTTGTPIIFDFDTYQQQKKLQSKLCEALPQFADLIRSTPEIMDGYPWICRDFIELYFRHYKIVIKKLRRLITQEKSDV